MKILKPVKNEIIVFILFMTLALLIYVFIVSTEEDEKGTKAKVIIDTQQVMEVDLNRDGVYDVPGFEGFELEVKKGAISVLKSQCPDQICVKTGPKNRKGDKIVCLPNKIIIEIEGEAITDSVAE